MCSIEFNHLPDELFPFIFNHLNINDLSRSRLVCKRWRLLIDELLKWDELIFRSTTYSDWYGRKEWFYTKNPIDKKKIIEISSNMMQSIFDQKLIGLKLLKDIKRLMILDDYNDSNMIYFKHLSQLTQLEQLECCLQIEQREDSINHPNLRIFSLRYTSDLMYYGSLELNMPKLQILSLDCNWVSNINFIHPLSIQHLKMCQFIGFLDFIDSFCQLSNLKTFEIDLRCDFDDAELNLSDILVSYSKLETLTIQFLDNCEDEKLIFDLYDDYLVLELHLSQIVHCFPELKNLILLLPCTLRNEKNMNLLKELLEKKIELNHEVQIQLNNILVNDVEQLSKI